MSKVNKHRASISVRLSEAELKNVDDAAAIMRCSRGTFLRMAACLSAENVAVFVQHLVANAGVEDEN